MLGFSSDLAMLPLALRPHTAKKQRASQASPEAERETLASTQSGNSQKLAYKDCPGRGVAAQGTNDRGESMGTAGSVVNCTKVQLLACPYLPSSAIYSGSNFP